MSSILPIDPCKLFICPHCRLPLVQTEKVFACANNHSFDLAKQGYLNLLPVNAKNSREPGDDKAMVQARTRFLDLGYYQPVADHIATCLNSYIKATPVAEESTLTVLDIGCGEGYYTSSLKKNVSQSSITDGALSSACSEAMQGRTQSETPINSVEIYGFDISKAAVLASAKRDKSITWFVGSMNSLPLAAHQFDFQLSVFSPFSAKETYNMAKPGGYFLTLSAGPDHLLELKQELYDTLNPATESKHENELSDYWEPIARTKVRFNIELLSQDHIAALLGMTPHFWRATPASKETFLRNQRFSCTVDMESQLFRRRDIPLETRIQGDLSVTGLSASAAQASKSGAPSHE